MRDRLSQATKDAMKAQDKQRLSTLRLISAALKDRDIAARVDDKGVSSGRDKITDQEFASLLQKMIKQRRDSIAAIEEVGAASQKDMGKVMAALKARYAGQMDFGKASGQVKALLK